MSVLLCVFCDLQILEIEKNSYVTYVIMLNIIIYAIFVY